MLKIQKFSTASDTQRWMPEVGRRAIASIGEVPLDWSLILWSVTSLPFFSFGSLEVTYSLEQDQTCCQQ